MKKKIKLNDLSVESFVTDARNSLRGGAPETWYCSIRVGCGVSVEIACISQGAQVCSDDSC